MQKNYFTNILKKLFSFCFLMIIVATLVGCEIQDEDGSNDYNLKKDIQGIELTEDQLIEEVNKINMSKNLLPCCEIKLTGNNILDQEPSLSSYIEKNAYSEVTLKYDFNSDSQEGIKLYANLKSGKVEVICFITNGYLYTNYTKNSVSIKNKIAISEVFPSLQKTQILKQILEVLNIDEIQENLNESIVDLIKQANEEQTKLTALKEANENIVLTYEEEDLKGRVVFNGEKVLYISVEEEDLNITLNFNYSKPKFNFPNTKDYKEANE